MLSLSSALRQSALCSDDFVILHELFGPTLRALGRAYVGRALAKPARFKLSFGAWNKGSAELREAAAESRLHLVSIVKAAQARSELPQSDAERLAALMLALVHGAVDQALAGHLSATGKGRASAEDLLDDLLQYLAQSVVPRRSDEASVHQGKRRSRALDRISGMTKQ